MYSFTINTPERKSPISLTRNQPPSVRSLTREGGGSTDGESFASLDFMCQRDIKWDTTSGFYICELCESHLYDTSYIETHIRSRKHQSNLGWRDYEEADRDPSRARMGDSDLGIPSEIECRGACWYRCSLCECPLGDPESIRAHCAGKRHQAALKKSNSSLSESLMPTSMKFHYAECVSEVASARKLSSTSTLIKPAISELTLKTYSEQDQRSHPNPCILPSAGWASPDSPMPESDYEGLAMSPLAEIGSYKLKGGRVIPPPPNYRPNTALGRK